MGNRRFEMFEYRQVLLRMRSGDSAIERWRSAPRRLGSSGSSVSHDAGPCPASATGRRSDRSRVEVTGEEE